MLLPTGLSEHYCYLFFSEIVSFVGFLNYVVFKNDLCVSQEVTVAVGGAELHLLLHNI